VLAYSATTTGFLIRVLDADGNSMSATTVTVSYHAAFTRVG
jgi:hypothetical protein